MKYEIQKEEKPLLIKELRTIFYSSTADEAEKAFKNAIPRCKKYPQFQLILLIFYLNEYQKTK